MPVVVGVTFRKVGKVYYFDPGDLELHECDYVIAETARGPEFGQVVIEPREVEEDQLVAPLKPIIRVANEDDLKTEAENREKEKHAFEVCERKIAEHGLPMKLLDSEYAFDGSQVTLFFSADGRVDFRELVKDVAGELKTKVQFHQIGVRDEAKLLGGFGCCGRELCCSTFLTSFEPISMKMAKDQSLFLNPSKFSGVCGKLMCCLRYEHDFYKTRLKQFPAVGAVLQLENGIGKVVDVNLLTGNITLQTEDSALITKNASELQLEGICRKHGIGCNKTEKGCFSLVASEEDAAALPEIDDDDSDIDISLSAFDIVPEELEQLEDEEVRSPQKDQNDYTNKNDTNNFRWRENKNSNPSQQFNSNKNINNNSNTEFYQNNDSNQDSRPRRPQGRNKNFRSTRPKPRFRDKESNDS
ncbi:MAG: stage 0 sporulation family protein [Armatimonadota bacterium]